MCRAAVLAVNFVLFGGVALCLQPNSKTPDSNPPTHDPHLRRGTPAPPSATESQQSADPTPLVAPDGSLTINPNQLDLRHEKGHWILRSGATWIKDFGGDGLAARTGYQLIRQLQLTQLAWVGKAQPTLEFFLRSDQPPPTPVGTGLQVITFQREAVEPKVFDGTWWLAEKDRPLLQFGESRADAEKALALIHQYQINQVAYIERPPLPMVLLSASSNQGPPRKSIADKPLKKTHLHDTSMSFPSHEQAKPDVMSAFTRLAFSYSQVLLRQTNGHWQLIVGRAVLKDFGPREKAAQDALKAMQYHRFTEQYRFGDEEESFEFYLAAGQAPRGRMLGQTGIFFNSKALTIRQSEEQGWVIHHDLQPLVGFKTREHAEQALEVIRRFRFDHLFRLGEPDSVMIYFTQGL